MTPDQPSLFDTPRRRHFGGSTYEAAHDEARLTTQYEKVFELMKDGQWRTLREIARAVHGSEAGCSARLRDARKAAFGGHTVERRRRGEPTKGLFKYRLIQKGKDKTHENRNNQ